MDCYDLFIMAKPPTIPLASQEDTVLDLTLRPKRLLEFVGQRRVKRNLNVAVSAAKKRGEPLEHVLVYGPPGLGKTTLAHVIAHELKKPIRVTSGPAIVRAGDLASILTALNDGEVLFIDEIHRLSHPIEEMLYPALEDFAIDIVVGKGPAAKSLRLDLPRFTLVGATTRASLISSPLRERFGHIYHLDYYHPDEISDILERSSRILKIKIDPAARREIARRARATPRIANRLLKRVRDYSEVASEKRISLSAACRALEELAIDNQGLDEVDRKILSAIQIKFAGGPAGIESIAAATAQDRSTIEDVCEPYLMQIGFLERTPKGRRLTRSALKHIGARPLIGALPGLGDDK